MTSKLREAATKFVLAYDRWEMNLTKHAEAIRAALLAEREPDPASEHRLSDEYVNGAAHELWAIAKGQETIEDVVEVLMAEIRSIERAVLRS